MDLRSLAYRTDLALLRLGGSDVEDRGSHLVVRTRANPEFYWGNYLLLPRAPETDRTDWWIEEFRREFPEAGHCVLAVDGTDGSPADLAAFAARGFEIEASTVMTARAVHPPPRPHTTATVRTLSGDDDWRRQVELSLVGEDAHRTEQFVQRRTAQHRSMVEAGHGRWFGAFLDGRLVSSLGLVDSGGGVARFQDVKTHPDERGRGLAGRLVHTASRFGFDELGVHTLVMVADPDYLAIRVYRSVGFEDTETQLGAARLP